MMTGCNFKTQGNSHRRQWGVLNVNETSFITLKSGRGFRLTSCYSYNYAFINYFVFDYLQ